MRSASKARRNVPDLDLCPSMAQLSEEAGHGGARQGGRPQRSSTGYLVREEAQLANLGARPGQPNEHCEDGPEA